MENLKKFWNTRNGKLVIVGGVGGLLLACCIVGLALFSEGSPAPAQDLSAVQTQAFETAMASLTTPTFPPPTETVEPTPSPIMLTDIDQIDVFITELIGPNNRDVVDRVSVIWSEAEQELDIKWAVNDNLFEDAIYTGAENDAKDILQALYHSDSLVFDYQLIGLDGTFSLIDQYGNTSESSVLIVAYSRSTLAKINWENALLVDIFGVADTSWFHPAFKK